MSQYIKYKFNDWSSIKLWIFKIRTCGETIGEILLGTAYYVKSLLPMLDFVVW